MLSWYPGVMKRIHTAAKWRESRAVENKTDVTEPPSGKNPHGTEAEIIHNSAQQQERRDDDSDSCFHDSVVVDCFTFYADGYFYHIRFLVPPLPPPLCFSYCARYGQHDATTPSSELQIRYRQHFWQHLGDAAIPTSKARASSRCSVLRDPLFGAGVISLLNDRELGAIGGRRSHLRK